MYSRILVPVDLDNVDKLGKALETAAEIAKRDGATVVYAGVVDTVPTPSARPEAAVAKERLDRFAAEQAEAHGIETADQVAMRRDLHLNVGSELIGLAKKTDCDLIVMASHMPGLKDHVFSSNAGYVATHAPVSVYVVR
ncbi:nucleotide-binding universal stress UspA family protein [Litoreibacter ponti]|uniref:Nucleotide-binding universal stress UspA family protein n=1 Tax=Litoreibacter ponti TaxID=1510457 RepID=A0A2T6BK29_9RHOB|nr:universal stress protein [Litoreibacter ponti]PTX56421.1 nucleotide-binding universal stress UspA family protein [Litoreibacter ponti]